MTSGVRLKALRTLAILGLVSAIPAPALACAQQGILGRCPPGWSLGGAANTGPLTRQDIEARTGPHGPAIVEEVARDTSRAWQAVRRQPLFPPIVERPDPTHIEPKGGRP
jgi:hypothetical protein